MSSVKPGAQRRLTIADVAAAAGVSRTTVSHALNDRGQVDPQTRARVKQIANELGYSPNLRAQRLRTGRTNSIALLSSMPFAVAGGPSRLGFMMEIAATAAEAALKQGLALVLVPPLEEARNLLGELDVDGAIIIEPVAEDPQVTQLQRRGIQVVSIGRQPDTEPTVPYVDMQAERTGRMLLEHLRERGARHIALLIGQQRRHSYVDVEQAYLDFTRRHQLPCSIIRAEEMGGEDAGAEACRRLLAEQPGVDAICAPVDAFAVGVVRALQEAGRRVPEDVRVVTRYDGLRAQKCEPPLTAVNLHLAEVADQAISLLLAQIGGKATASIVQCPPPELIVRRSSAD
ncbi:LacI family DNA-binding transcriptional regulator [Oceanimonas sp. MB9]|uniref:LacI family DNA-binding transcriptional regulator n=1 Tax=Oceanimonas sp. MB9 TaxID=2588453 RepID=UPI0013F5E9DF|nr:LacI family DNA-binding transcriptional regulator [Oceanimonas sp. MB9]NHH99184.1 HTH-type transcriptional regulator DegA [Oceanimonas sp. MB9]